MTKDQWLMLKTGDVIIEVKTGVERVVLDVKRVPHPRGVRTSISLPKLYSGGTKHAHTTYSNNDDRGRWKLKGDE